MKPKTTAEKAYHARVAALGCILCGAPATIHHKTGAGMGLRASHYDVIPLCPMHHQHGGYGVAVHAGTKEWERRYGTQDALIEQVKRMLKA